jgi:hypothetical protein
MERSIVDVMNIEENLISCAQILGFLHENYMNNHPIDDLCLTICLGVEGSGFGDFNVQQLPEARPKCVEEHIF